MSNNENNIKLTAYKDFPMYYCYIKIQHKWFLEWHVCQMQGTDIAVLPCHSTEDPIWTKSALIHKNKVFIII